MFSVFIIIIVVGVIIFLIWVFKLNGRSFPIWVKSRLQLNVLLFLFLINVSPQEIILMVCSHLSGNVLFH